MRFAAGVVDDDGKLVGVATAGRLISRVLDPMSVLEVKRRRAAGETLEQIAGIAESTPETEKKPSLQEVYKQAFARHQKSSGPISG
jgi:hypothetical protein